MICNKNLNNNLKNNLNNLNNLNNNHIKNHYNNNNLKMLYQMLKKKHNLCRNQQIQMLECLRQVSEKFQI